MPQHVYLKTKECKKLYFVTSESGARQAAFPSEYYKYFEPGRVKSQEGEGRMLFSLEQSSDRKAILRNLLKKPSSFPAKRPSGADGFVTSTFASFP